MEHECEYESESEAKTITKKKKSYAVTYFNVGKKIIKGFSNIKYSFYDCIPR